MKNHKILIIILSVLLLGGCEDFLDKNPLDQISAATFYKSKTDFDMALTANYGLMNGAEVAPWGGTQWGIWGWLAPNMGNITDNGYGQHGYGGSKQIVGGDITPSTGGYIKNVYTSCYKAIARENIFLTELSAYEGNDFPDSEKKIAEAEVRFMRAFHYFQLYNHYGAVPMVLEPLTIENQEQAKVDASQVFEQVMIDLDFAIQNLNDVSFGENNGHVTKSTAQAFKARALLCEAYGDTGSPNTTILGEVAELCTQVMPQYSLSPAFTDLFQDAGQKGNPEIIWSINYLAPDNVPRWANDLLYAAWAACEPLQNFVDAFEYTDGLPVNESDLVDPDDPWKNRDMRFFYTVFGETIDFGDGPLQVVTSNKPYGLKKFLCPENIPASYSTLSQQNTVVLRLGEVMLMYAEAQNEVTGPDETVYKMMNDLRDRVNMPPLPVGLSKEQMRERIRNERRVELAFEGLRYFDLKRWRIAGEVYNSISVEEGYLNYVWDDRFYHWPLPQDEIDRHHGALIQNPDYQ